MQNGDGVGMHYARLRKRSQEHCTASKEGHEAVVLLERVDTNDDDKMGEYAEALDVASAREVIRRLFSCC